MCSIFIGRETVPRVNWKSTSFLLFAQLYFSLRKTHSTLKILPWGSMLIMSQWMHFQFKKYLIYFQLKKYSSYQLSANLIWDLSQVQVSYHYHS